MKDFDFYAFQGRRPCREVCSFSVVEALQGLGREFGMTKGDMELSLFLSKD
jgi:hypothetical protein